MMSDELKDRLEKTFITRPFNIGWVPIKSWEELDEFCKEHYNNNRRSMILDLLSKVKDDWKFEMLYYDLEALTARVSELEAKNKESVKTDNRFKTFGV